MDYTYKGFGPSDDEEDYDWPDVRLIKRKKIKQVGSLTMDEKVKKFLTKFYEQLKDDCWGDIDPEYFNPDFVDDKEYPTNQLTETDAMLIQKYVKTH